MLNKLLKSVLDQDRAPIVVCNTDDIIIYMNPSAKSAYHKDLTGSNIKDCHPKEANEKIDKVIRWFMESAENNIIYTYHNDKENKDVYMVALRDEESTLIGYYEKHEYRNRETANLYDWRKKMRILIVGGVAGGATAAARLRRLDESAEIIIFERSGYVSYANCGLPYYIGDEITDRDELTLQTPQSFQRRFKIDVRTHHEVREINREEKKITVCDLNTGRIFEEEYDKLILSPGARPVAPEFAKINSDRIFTLRTVEDTFKIKDYIKNKVPKSAVVIGGGFTGLEMAENLKRLGLGVTIIQRGNQLLDILDSDMASFVHSKLKSQGIKLLFNASVKEVSDGEKLVISGENMPDVSTDIVIVSVGVVPESALAEKSGLALSTKGSIAVDDTMLTSDENIYAVGDAVEITHRVSGNKALIALAGPANKQGRIAADNICGIKSKYEGSQGSSAIKLFDMTAAATGLNEKQINAVGIQYEKVILSPLSHAGYYPGATVMTLKVLFDKKTLKILGAQAVGYDGVDKRIDVLATCIFSGLTADKLKDLDLAYAPPYSSAKDPVNMAGFIIDNIISGITKLFHYDEIEMIRTRNDVILLDTRTVGEYSRGHAEGFINIPLDDLRNHITELDKSKKIYVMCQSGLRSYIATRILMQNGFDAYNFSGGYRLYSSIYSDRLASNSSYECGLEK